MRRVGIAAPPFLTIHRTPDSRRLAGKYGLPVQALETFVGRDRFKGTCYRATDDHRTIDIVPRGDVMQLPIDHVERLP